MLENLFNSPFLTSLALTLLHFLWQGLLVATVLKSALLIFNHNKPQLRYALSALAMLVNLLLPIITFIIVYQGELLASNSLANSLALNELILELKQPDALFNYKQLTETLPLLLPYISVLWLTTITFLAGKLLIELSTVNQLPQQGTVAPSDKLQARFNALVKQINLKITPRLFISIKVEVPMAIGWLKPVVLLPASMISGLNNAQLEMLILHELAHIRRHDYLVNFLQTLVEILLFFHPAVLWVSKQMRNEREYCSDDIAVQHCGDAIAYAHTLADTASLCTKAHKRTIPDMAMAASGGDLKQRVTRLVGHHCAPSNNVSKWLASATIIFSVLLLSSTQLLTMPLFDIWHNKNPWEHENHALSSTTSNSEQKQVSSTPFKQDSRNTSMAQELTYQSDEQNKSMDKKSPAWLSTEIPTQEKPGINLVKKSQHSNNNSPTINNEVSRVNTKLDKLSAKYSQPKEDINTRVASNTLMVEKAFERTNTSTPYQQQLAELQADQIIAGDKSINKVGNAQHTAFLNDPSSTNQLHDNTFNNNTPANTQRTIKPFTNLDFSTRKEIISPASTWHNAQQLKSAAPVYPNVAKRKGIEIEVKVNFTIGIDGQIKNIEFTHQNNINYFKNAIRLAIKKWRFLPAQDNGQPVESQMTKVFAFSLKN